MELRNELRQLGDEVEAATKQVQDQLDNVGHTTLPFSLASLVGAIVLAAKFNILLSWVPTSFILWVLYCIWSAFDLIRNYKSQNKDDLFRQYDKLSNKHKTFGHETFVKRLIPLSRAGAAIYIISAIILVLAKAEIISSPDNFSIWLPFVVDVLLAALLLSGPVLSRRITVSRANEVVNLYRNRTNLVSSIQRPLILVCSVSLALFILIPFCYFGLPIWSLTATWGLYQSNANGYLILIVLILQVLFAMLLLGYLTQQSAKTDLSNNVANLSNIHSRITQLLRSSEISANEIHILRGQYYEAIKYRFIQKPMFGFIPVYSPVLNEAYVKADTK
jgi:hypothetical protein